MLLFTSLLPVMNDLQVNESLPDSQLEWELTLQGDMKSLDRNKMTMR